MKIDDRHSTIIWADEKTYVDDADYRDFIAKRIQDGIANALITALCTKDAIVAIKGDSTTQKDEFRSGIICRQDVYIKDLVQCKDCKYNYANMIPGGKGCQRNVYIEVDDNFFCANGERDDKVEE